MNTIGAQLLLILFVIVIIFGFVGVIHYVLSRAEQSEIKKIPIRYKELNRKK